MADILVNNEGTVVLFQLLTGEAREWWEANVADGPVIGSSPVVERRCAPDIIEGARADGLEVEI